MKCKLLLPYIDYYNTNFDVDDNYYSNGGYENALKTNNSMYGDSIYNHMNQNGGILSNSNNFNMGINIFNQNTHKSDEKTSYSSCEGYLYDENMNDETVFGLENYIKNQDVFVLFIKLDFDTIEEEFETDFKMWVKSHNKINSYKADDDWKFANEPKKNVRVEVNGLTVDLLNCKILDVSNDKIAVLVEKIKYVI